MALHSGSAGVAEPGGGGKGSSHILTDQLTLPQRGEQIMPTILQLAPQIFKPSSLPTVHQYLNLVRQRFASDYYAMPILNQMCKNKNC